MQSVPLSLTRRLLIPLIGACLLLTGCHSRTPEHELDMPSEGKARIISRQIEKTDKRLHWKWSLIGERNWRKASAQDASLTLADTYPINDATKRGGCNIWECDLEAERGPDGIHWIATLHGSDGATAKSSGVIPGGGTGDVDSVVSILQDQDSQPGLPADTPLASLHDKTLTLHLAS